MNSDKIEVLYDHYKDTCSITGDAVKRRDRLLLLVIAILSLFAFQAVFPVASSLVISEFLSFKLGVTFKLDLAIIGNIVWFLLLVFSLRYFQVATFVERQYPYLHKLEDTLNQYFQESVITREGKHYLSEYPLFSDWMWALYTIVFPLLLLLVIAVEMFSEIMQGMSEEVTLNLALNLLFFLLLFVAIVFYLIMVHKGDSECGS